MKRISAAEMTRLKSYVPPERYGISYKGLVEDPAFWAEFEDTAPDDENDGDLDPSLIPCGMPLKLGMAAREWGISERTLWKAKRLGVGPPTFKRGRLLWVCRRAMREWAWHNAAPVPTSDGKYEFRWMWSVDHMRPLKTPPCRHGEIEP